MRFTFLIKGVLTTIKSNAGGFEILLGRCAPSLLKLAVEQKRGPGGTIFAQSVEVDLQIGSLVHCLASGEEKKTQQNG